MLELGSGGNVSHMKQAFVRTLVEPVERTRELSPALNSECIHVAGDLRNVPLGRRDRRFAALHLLCG